LFVGMTRATLKLILVITDASAQALKPLIDREP
jgi:hypothetical protein